MKRGRLLRRIVWLALAGLVVAGLVWALLPRPVELETAAVTRGALTATVTGEGRTRVDDLYVVAAPVDGALQRIMLTSGQPVSAGSVVARVDPATSRPLDARTRAEARAAVAAARAALARAEATEDEARVAVLHSDRELERSQKLAESGAVATRDAEHAVHQSEASHRAFEAARAAVHEARAGLARANALLSVPSPSDGDGSVPVTAPVEGVVLRVLRESGGPVAAGTPLLEIGDVDDLEVRAELLSTDAASVRPGASATITRWGGPRALPARVRYVEPAAFTKISALGLEEQRVHVLLDLLEAVPTGLGHDYRVDVEIETWSGADVLRVPSTALFRSGDRWAVFTVVDGRARLTPVETGETDGAQTVILDGLTEGDTVVVHPTDAVEEGTRVGP